MAVLTSAASAGEASPRPESVGWRQALAEVAWIFVVSRLVLFGVFVVCRFGILPGAFWQPGGLVDVLAQIDGANYLAGGEEAALPNASAAGEDDRAVLPLFAILVQLTSLVIRETGLAAVLVANASLLCAGLLLHRLASLSFDDAKVARIAVMFLMFSPFSVFFAGASPQATHLALALAALWFALKRKWIFAAVAAICLSLVTETGWMIVVPLLLEFLGERAAMNSAPARSPWLQPPRVWFAVGFLALAAFVASVVLVSPPQHAWSGVFADLMNRSSAFTNYRRFYEGAFWAALIGATALLAAGVFLKMRASYVVYAALLILEFVWRADSEIVPASLMAAFPLSLAAALVSARSRLLYEPLIACSMTLLTVCVILVAGGYWPV